MCVERGTLLLSEEGQHPAGWLAVAFPQCLMDVSSMQVDDLLLGGGADFCQNLSELRVRRMNRADHAAPTASQKVVVRSLESVLTHHRSHGQRIDRVENRGFVDQVHAE